jgi:two-component system, cell cycle response regulator CpdR
MSLILLAEDDGTMRVFLSKALTRAGHRVTAVDDGLKALDEVVAGRFDLLIADIVMPSLDGFQLAAKAKSHQPALKVMFITGFAAVTLSSQGGAPLALREAVGADARILSKPFHLRDLVDEVEKILAA